MQAEFDVELNHFKKGGIYSRLHFSGIQSNIGITVLCRLTDLTDKVWLTRYRVSNFANVNWQLCRKARRSGNDLWGELEALRLKHPE